MKSHNYKVSLTNDLNLIYIIPKCNNFFKRKIKCKYFECWRHANELINEQRIYSKD